MTKDMIQRIFDLGAEAMYCTLEEDTRKYDKEKFVKLKQDATDIFTGKLLSDHELGDFVDWIREIGFKKYREGWCGEGGSNGWHCNTDELIKMFRERTIEYKL